MRLNEPAGSADALWQRTSKRRCGKIYGMWQKNTGKKGLLRGSKTGGEV